MNKVSSYPWEYYVRPFKIIENLYYIGNKDVSVHLLAGSDGVVLIDSGYPQTVYQVLENIRILGFDPYTIRAIIHTHAHYDHCGGTKAIIETTGAKTYLGKEDITIIEKEHMQTWAPEYGTVFYEQFGVDFALDDGGIIEYGDISINCVASPGHTAGTMSLFFDVRDNGRTYKAGLHGGPGRNTLTREYLNQYGLPLKNRDIFLDSIKKLKNIPVDIVLGIHPFWNDTFRKAAEIKEGHNPFIDAGEWGRFLHNLETNALDFFAKD